MFSVLTSIFGNNKANAKLDIGTEVSSLQAINENGDKISIDFNEGYTLIYFYPKADTPGCTAQACSLCDSYTELTQKGVRVFGVSTDKPAAQLKFKQKYKLPFTLISDTDKKIAKTFGVPVNLGFTSRQAFLVKNNKVVWLDRSASTQKQAQDILQELKNQEAKK